jgi:hypothetical protein
VVDPIVGLVALLKADSAVNALVDGRVFGGDLPRNQAFTETMPVQSVVLRPAGGREDNGLVPVVHWRIDAICYGPDSFECMELLRAVHDALKYSIRQTFATVFIHSATISSGPVYLVDQETRWPMAFESWVVSAAETVAA